MTPLQECSDEELCSLALTGDPQAEECLVSRYTRLVRICARPYFLAGADTEDLIQEGMIGLLSAIRSFSKEKGVLFRTYAETCIRNRLRSAVKSAAREKHAPLNSSLSLDAPRFEESSESYQYQIDSQRLKDPEEAFIDREEREDRIGALRGRLSALEKAVLDFYLDGLSYTEIALRTGKTTKAVDNAVRRIRRKAAPFFTSGDISEC